MSGPLRLGTRASPLALVQARLVAAALAGEVAVVEIATSGDGGAGGGDKSRWVDRIEDALLAGTIDLAVHSAKDLPGELAGGLEIAGSPARGDPRDALCGAASLAALRRGARVGTSSLRRAAQLRALREDLEVVAIAGNVQTRLARVGELDAVVLARAGLERLGLDRGAELAQLVPAAGQGTLAIEARAGDERVAAAIAGLRDGASERALAAERALTSALGADCRAAVGALATADGEELELIAFAGRADGSAWVRDTLRGRDPQTLGAELAQRMRSVGAAELLA
ncbi:MAG TPA: hydroxymethylbilane synthase [Solirubrobacteraceae bacterium]|nr:hydroxymethylbilane synthase [Solirubrobacteraceae bacterium]